MTAAEQDLGLRVSEFSWAKKTADEYRARGYEVALDADVDFLPGHKLDLVACKGDDKRIIEVKRRSSLQHDPKIDKIARTVETQPGWSFDIVLVPEPLNLATPSDSRPLGSDRALRSVDLSEQLASMGQPEAALVMSWSACEALLRERVEEESGTSDYGSLTQLLLDSATMYGVISHDGRDYLKSLLPLRNAIAHGFSHAEVDSAAIAELAQFVRQLAEDAPEDASI